MQFNSSTVMQDEAPETLPSWGCPLVSWGQGVGVEHDPQPQNPSPLSGPFCFCPLWLIDDNTDPPGTCTARAYKASELERNRAQSFHETAVYLHMQFSEHSSSFPASRGTRQD